MISSVHSAVVQGINSHAITVEGHMSSGIPQINVVGLPDQTIREAKDRILVALQSLQIKLPNKKFILSLNPTDMKKQGGHMDLPMAIALLKACGYFPDSQLRVGALGAMNLSGEIQETNQIFALIENLVAQECDVIFIPEQLRYAKRFFKNSNLLPVKNLIEVVKLLRLTDLQLVEKVKTILAHDEVNIDSVISIEVPQNNEYLDFNQVKGQEVVKRAIMFAVAGKHHLFMYGPPGTGKTMLAARIPSILAALDEQYIYERLKTLSCAGEKINPQQLALQEPFRSPHSAVSISAMLGGMQAHMIGEAALAHRGILFLDEMPEYKRDVLEGLRGPLESGEIHLSKTHYKAIVASRFTLVATANPCPCGFHGFSDQCNCNQRTIERYFSKISGPVLDRFDLKVEVAFKHEVDLLESLNDVKPIGTKTSPCLDSLYMYNEVQKVRAIQNKRYQNEYNSNCTYNGLLNPKEVTQWCQLTISGEKWVKENLTTTSQEDSLRHHYKIIKLARTIADFEASEKIDRKHLVESFYYNRRKLI